MDRRFLAVPALAIALLTAAACSPGSHSITKPTSSAAATAEAVLSADITACQPKTVSRSAWEISLVTSSGARTALVGCLKIPAGPKRTAFYSCLLDGAKSAMKTPGKQAREEKIISAAGRCLSTARS